MFDTIHPAVVHFPIALLVIYSLLEVASLVPAVRRKRTIWYIKLFLVVVGRLSIQLALQSGESMKEAGYGFADILAWHEYFADLSTIIYGVAALGYVLQRFLFDGVATRRGQKILGTALHRTIQGIVYFYRKTGLLYILAIAGFIALMTTGALGGAMVYGEEIDPMVKFITDLLPIN